jgi:uncharacterized delta-60 repeat protein
MRLGSRGARTSRGRPLRWLTTPHAELLEARRLLAFDQGPVLQESFDDLTLTPDQLLAPSGWDDDKVIPAPAGSNQPPTPTNTPLFHHQMTQTVAGSGTSLKQGGTTTFQGLPSQDLSLSGVSDVITFPNVDPRTEAVTIASVDVQRGFPGAEPSVTFVGANGSETLVDPIPASEQSPGIVSFTPGSTGHGVIGIVYPPTTAGWDTLAATTDDLLPDGSKLGAITSIRVDGPVDANSFIDKVRVFIAPNPLHAGDLDPSFNQDGEASAYVGTGTGSFDITNGAGALQPDGRIVVVGGGFDPAGGTLALVRFSTAGQAEQTLRLNAALGVESGDAVAIDDNPASPHNGDIVVAGTWFDSTLNQNGVALVLFKPDLTLDTSFGTGGVVLEHGLGPVISPTTVMIQPDDAILVGGYTNSGTLNMPIGGSPFVARFRPDGTPDTTFANQGVLTNPFAAVPVPMTGRGLALESNGEIVAAAIQTPTPGRASSLLALTRLTAGGQVDSTFGTNGIQTTTIPSIGDVSSVAIDPARGILVAGDFLAAGPNANEDFFVGRYDFQGNPDPTFNNGALETVDFQGPGRRGYSQARAITVQPDGKVLVAGSTAIPVPGKIFPYQPFNFALVRLNTDGSLDSGFGTGGLVDNPDDANHFAASVLVQADGNIVVTGRSERSTAANDLFAVARYLGNPPPIGGGNPPPTARDAVYELPQGAAAGQNFTSSQIAAGNFSGPSVLGGATTTPSGAALHARLIQGPAHDPGFQLNDDGTFTYTPDSTFQGTDSFTFVANNGTSDSNIALVTIVTQGSPHDTDGDSVPDVVEAFAPNLGDGNLDTAPDYLEGDVASLVAADGQYWTLVTSNGSFDRVVNQLPNPLKPAPPQGVSVPAGLFGFRIVGLTPGQSVVVTATPAGNSPVGGFFEFDDPDGTWTSVPSTASAGGAITLHLTDGHIEDLDGETNGTITILGGPADLTGTPFAPDIHQAVPHGTLGSVTIATNAAQLNSGPVQLALVTGPGNDPAHGSVTIDQGTGTFTYTSNYTPVDEFGHNLLGWSNLVISDSFAYEVEINGHASAVARVFLEPVDQPPSVGSHSISTEIAHGNIDHPLSLGDLLKASDPDGDPLSITGSPGSGNLVPDINGDGGFTYQHDPTKILPTPADPSQGVVHDIFTVQVADPYLVTATATIDLVIDDQVPAAPPNEIYYLQFGVSPPDQPLSLTEDLHQLADPMLGVKDPDPGDRIVAAAVRDYPRTSNGQPDADASFDSSFNLDFQTDDQHFGDVRFPYAVTDGIAYSPNGAVEIQEVRSGPFLRSQVYTVSPNGYLAAGNLNHIYNLNGTDIPVTQPGLLAGDTFFNGVAIGPFVEGVEAATLPQHGQIASSKQNHFFGSGDQAPLLLDNDGGFVYKPNPGFVGWDSFTFSAIYPVLPGNGDDKSTALIHVTGQNETDTNMVSFADSTPDHSQVTLSSPAGTKLVDAQAIPNPHPSDSPPGVDFPFGFFSFTVAGIVSNTETQVTLEFPSPLPDGFTYYKYGQLPGGLSNYAKQWYPFPFTAAEFGAKTHADDPSIPPNAVVLFLNDGGTGDDDLPDKGIITDPGGIGVRGYFVAAPTLSGPAVGVREQPLNFTVSATDPAAEKLAAGFTYAINWGDGTPPETIARTPGNGAGVPLDHVFKTLGTFQVTVTATDEFGTANQPVRLPVSIRTVALEPDPLAPGHTMLAVGGTDEADKTRVQRVRGGALKVTVDGIVQGTFQVAGRVAIWGGAGNDQVRLDAHLREPIELFASPGNFRVIGGAGDEVFINGMRQGKHSGRGARQAVAAGHQPDRLVARQVPDRIRRNDLRVERILASAEFLEHVHSIAGVGREMNRRTMVADILAGS